MWSHVEDPSALGINGESSQPLPHCECTNNRIKNIKLKM